MHLNYLRISVTDRCNLNCFYCLPLKKKDCIPREEILRYEEIAFLVKILAKLGIEKIRLTGGEPLVRRNIEELLKMLSSIDNQLFSKQVSENTFSFGIKEYLEIPGVEYQRDIGVMGLDVTVVFKRAGRRVKLRKIKESKIPKRQRISKEEIIKFMEEKFGTNFI